MWFQHNSSILMYAFSDQKAIAICPGNSGNILILPPRLDLSQLQGYVIVADSTFTSDIRPSQTVI
jgi:hypothetical protein